MNLFYEHFICKTTSNLCTNKLVGDVQLIKVFKFSNDLLIFQVGGPFLPKL